MSTTKEHKNVVRLSGQVRSVSDFGREGSGFKHQPGYEVLRFLRASVPDHGKFRSGWAKILYSPCKCCYFPVLNPGLLHDNEHCTTRPNKLSLIPPILKDYKEKSIAYILHDFTFSFNVAVGLQNEN